MDYKHVSDKKLRSYLNGDQQRNPLFDSNAEYCLKLTLKALAKDSENKEIPIKEIEWRAAFAQAMTNSYEAKDKPAFVSYLQRYWLA